MNPRYEDTEPADAAAQIPGTNLRLGHIFEFDAEEETAHRLALRDACQRASNRARIYDQPWWAANVRALLDYVEACESALRQLTTEPATGG